MKRQKFVTVAVIALSTALCSFTSLRALQEDDAVQKAFGLRMNGKADEARALLEQDLASNPRNAAALFELARTNLHIGLGSPRDLIETFPERVVKPIEKAVSLDPKNADYAMFAADMAFTHAYMSMKGQGGDIKKRVEKMCDAYKSVVKIDPNRLRPMLCLVEIYAVLPEQMGGDRSKAEALAEEVEKKDAVYGAKARSLLLPENADRIEYWSKVLEKNERNADVLEELGKACLSGGEIDRGVKYLEEAIQADPQKDFLLLDLGRFHIYAVMRDASNKKTVLPAAERAINKFIEREPIKPLKAYSFGLLAMIKRGSEEKEAIEEMREKANKIDPFHSKATGLPSLDLFVPPGEPSRGHRYLFRPL